MGCVASTPTDQTPKINVNRSITNLVPDSSDNEDKADEPITRDKDKNFRTTHSKQNERYFNRQFKVSVCSAQGERRNMEDDHLCQFILSNHPNYSLFGVFDGHNGPNASSYLAQNLYKVLNKLPDLENNKHIISSIKKMDRRYLAKSNYNTAGSTIVFVIINSDFDSVVKMSTERSLGSTPKATKKAIKGPPMLSKVTTKQQSKFAYGNSRKLAGFEIKYGARVFWCGDSRGYLVHGAEDEKGFQKWDYLTRDHDTKNAMELKRVKRMNGKIINGRVDGKLMVTRSFGDSRMKYDGSAVISRCEYKEFEVNVGDSLLLCCDGLVEKWNNKILMERLMDYLNAADKNDTDTDTVKVIGDLVDDAIYEGSEDNISAMLIQLKDGTKQKTNAKYHNLKSI